MVVNLAVKEEPKFLKLMQFDHLNFNGDDGLMSIEDLRALRLRKKKIESDKKARKYIPVSYTHLTLPTIYSV